MAVYWSSAVGHARPHAKAPFLSGLDPTTGQLWGHGGPWPLHAILTAPGAKRIRTKGGQEKQKQRKLRRRDENRQKKWQNWGWASQPQTEEWSGWSQEDSSGRGWRGQEADEEQWHGAEEGDSDDDESRGDWHSDRRVSFCARGSVARESAAGAGSSTDPILVPLPPPPPTGPPPRQRIPPTPDGAADRLYYVANPVITFTGCQNRRRDSCTAGCFDPG